MSLDRQPDCPDCDTDVFVGRESMSHEYKCEFCDRRFDKPTHEEADE
jgi:ribosomal protein L37AE/L43A